VLLEPDPHPPWVDLLRADAARAGEDTGAALELARRHGRQLPVPGRGQTALRWSALAELGRVNLTAARVVEAHVDALAILAESGGDPGDDRTWGVFAAETPGVRLDACMGTGGTVELTGTKPWCSLGDQLDAALVTARVGDRRQLFQVDLRQERVRADPPDRWVARGLRTVTSGAVHFDAAPATAVGAPGWYLERPGFAWGGIGVAACWYGGARGLADLLTAVASKRDGELNALHVGTVDVALHAAATALTHAAGQVDAGAADPELLAGRTRAVVADAAERVLHQVGHALGPSPLAFDAAHAGRVADLTLYIRQHHGERDLAALGDQVLDGRR
jgi:alkylation response protein AidB-like acyl-CoA dehydrogenase